MLASLIGSRAFLDGYAWVDAREAYERVLALDPQNAYALWHLATFAARDHRLADLLYNAPAHQPGPDLSRGEKQKAIQHYRRAVELWRDCDPMLQPSRQQAASELARLQGR